MKRTLIAAALCLGATAVLAQAPAAPAAPAAPVVPAANCDPKPVYPGMKVLQDDDKRMKFQASLKTYQDCIKDYVAERKAYIEATNNAIRTSVEEHNAVMGKIRDDQEAAKKELAQ